MLSNGTASLGGTAFLVSYAHAGQEVHVVWEPAGIMFIDAQGEIIAEHVWPPTGTTYVSKHTPDPSRGGRPRTNPRPSPKS